MINTLILDVDGVLTDGAILYGDSGETIKKFHIRDGKGIQLAKLGGMKIYIITTSAEKLIRNRAKKLGMEKETFLGIKNKFKCLEELKVKEELKFESIAFVGDDVNDIIALETVGFPIAVNDAVDEVKSLVKKRNGLITKRKGGEGAVREAIEFILKSQGRWEKVIAEDLARQRNEVH